MTDINEMEMVNPDEIANDGVEGMDDENDC
jgi:hypothetical protein